MVRCLLVLFWVSTACATGEAVAMSANMGNRSHLVELFGVTMLPLWVASSILATLIFERLSATRRNRIVDDATVDAVVQIMASGGIEAAQQACSASPTVLGQAWAKGLRDFRLGRESLKDSLMKSVRSTLQPLEESTRSVQTIAAIAPLMGLLGTILGMVQVFGELSNTVTPNKSALADGIMVALFTTAAGLVIAIPGIVCGRWLNSRIASYSELAEQVVDRMHEAYCAAGGIEPRRKRKKGRSYGI